LLKVTVSVYPPEKTRELEEKLKNLQYCSAIARKVYIVSFHREIPLSEIVDTLVSAV